MTTQQSNTKLTMPIEDTIILDSKKCNAELLTIHADGRITVAEHLKPTETAAAVLQIMQYMWLSNQQVVKIKELNEHIKLLKSSGNELLEWVKDGTSESNYRLLANAWQRAKEAKP